MAENNNTVCWFNFWYASEIMLPWCSLGFHPTPGKSPTHSLLVARSDLTTLLYILLPIQLEVHIQPIKYHLKQNLEQKCRYSGSAILKQTQKSWLASFLQVAPEWGAFFTRDFNACKTWSVAKIEQHYLSLQMGGGNSRYAQWLTIFLERKPYVFMNNLIKRLNGIPYI